MQHADIDRALMRGAELRQQTLRRVLLREAHAVHDDVQAAPRKRDRFRAAAEHFHQLRQGEFARNAGLGVVVAANDEGLDPRLVQAAELVREKARGLHRSLLAVVEVAGDQERVDLLSKRELDHGGKGFARRSADHLRKRRLAQRQSAQRRVKVDIGGVNESEGHSFLGVTAGADEVTAETPHHGG